MTTLNTTPFFASIPSVQWTNTDGNGGAAGPLKTANNVYDGTGTMLTVFTGDATYWSFLTRLKIWAAGSNASANVLRIFGNNGSTNATVGNNYPIAEVPLQITTASATAPLQPYNWIPEDSNGVFYLPPNHKIMVCIGTTVTAGYFISAFGGILGP